MRFSVIILCLISLSFTQQRNQYQQYGAGGSTTYTKAKRDNWGTNYNYNFQTNWQNQNSQYGMNNTSSSSNVTNNYWGTSYDQQSTQQTRNPQLNIGESIDNESVNSPIGLWTLGHPNACIVVDDDRNIIFGYELFEYQGKVAARIKLLTPFNKIGLNQGGLYDIINAFAFEGIFNLQKLMQRKRLYMELCYTANLYKIKDWALDPFLSATEVCYTVNDDNLVFANTENGQHYKFENYCSWEKAESYMSAESVLFVFDTKASELEHGKEYYVTISLWIRM